MEDEDDDEEEEQCDTNKNNDEDEDENVNGVDQNGGHELQEGENGHNGSSHCRLRRRDTPHHLKGARIQSPGTNKAQQLDANEMREILDKYKPVPAARTTLQPTSTTSPAVTSNGSSSHLVAAIDLPVADLARNDPIRKHIQLVISMTVGASGGLGIRIAGGKGSANPYRDDDDGVFITRILADSPARNTGMKVGDKLLKVNNLSLNEMSHQQAADALKDAVKAGQGAQLSLSVLQEVDYNKVR